MDNISRRRFLWGGAAAASFGASLLTMTGCSQPEISSSMLEPDANGLRLLDGFSSRIVAVSGSTVEGTDYTWHDAPDGGACFSTTDGGWSYVSNSETERGGAGYLEFDSNGTVIAAGSILSGTSRNCAGGIMPWGTWLSCEEVENGQVWECHPTGAAKPVLRAAMGTFMHEAAAADPDTKAVYMTEDLPDGALYQFVPEEWGNLGSGVLNVLTLENETYGWQPVPDPSATSEPTRQQVPKTVQFNGGEGIALHDKQVVFTTKGDNRVWVLDPKSMSLSVLYDPTKQVNGVLSGVDNVAISEKGAILVAEDGGDMQVVLVRDDGSTLAVVEVTESQGMVPPPLASEVTGPAFDPSGTRLYFSSQRFPGVTYEVSGPWQDVA